MDSCGRRCAGPETTAPAWWEPPGSSWRARAGAAELAGWGVHRMSQGPGENGPLQVNARWLLRAAEALLGRGQVLCRGEGGTPGAPGGEGEAGGVRGAGRAAKGGGDAKGRHGRPPRGREVGFGGGQALRGVPLRPARPGGE